MARRSFRRKRRVTWLPVFGNAPAGATSDDNAIGVELNLPLAGDGTIRWEAFGLTFDYSDSASFDQGTFSKTLADLTSGNEWVLKRIVGKIFASWWPGAEGQGGAPPVIDWAIGFIVCNTDDEGNPTTNFDNVNPLHQDSGEDPWAFRRRWVFNPYKYAAPADQDGVWAQGFPNGPAHFGSVADGPHIDQTTVRRIHRQQRLFFVHAVRAYAPGGVSETYSSPGTIYGFLDYRLLGNVAARLAGNRGNAAR